MSEQLRLDFLSRIKFFNQKICSNEFWFLLCFVLKMSYVDYNKKKQLIQLFKYPYAKWAKIEPRRKTLIIACYIFDPTTRKMLVY